MARLGDMKSETNRALIDVHIALARGFIRLPTAEVWLLSIAHSPSLPSGQFLHSVFLSEIVLFHSRVAPAKPPQSHWLSCTSFGTGVRTEDSCSTVISCVAVYLHKGRISDGAKRKVKSHSGVASDPLQTGILYSSPSQIVWRTLCSSRGRLAIKMGQVEPAYLSDK